MISECELPNGEQRCGNVSADVIPQQLIDGGQRGDRDLKVRFSTLRNRIELAIGTVANARMITRKSRDRFQRTLKISSNSDPLVLYAFPLTTRPLFPATLTKSLPTMSEGALWESAVAVGAVA
jgi:hypothetical protein